jgi:cellulose synthase/poly-beta-1,6-N-acetylglucosamine synthase-like glycosyltransferase
MTPLLDLYQYLILAYFLVQNGFQFLFILRSFFFIREYQNRTETDTLEEIFGTDHYKPISLVCPAYNEAAGVVKSVHSLLALRYPRIEVIVVNDGSRDDTVDLLVSAFRMIPSARVVRQGVPCKPIRAVYESPYVPNLVVIDKENGGKSDALNCGLNFAAYPLVCTMDGDSLLENDALLRGVRPFLDEAHVVAVGGVIRPVNGCVVTPMGIRGIHLPAAWLPRFQVLEYFRAFLYGRVGLSSLHMLFIVSGAFAIFRREALLRCGGFATATIGEDLEMVVRMHRHFLERGEPYRIAMVPDPICWTEVPSDLATLARQRNRWQRGLLESLWAHRRMCFNPAYGTMGLISIPYFLLFEAMAPLLEASGYLLFLWFCWHTSLNTPYVVLFLWLAIFLGILNSIVAIALAVSTGHRYQGVRALVTLLATALLENLGYRQLTVWWRLRGTLDFLRGKQGWGRMTRAGIGSAPKGS